MRAVRGKRNEGWSGDLFGKKKGCRKNTYLIRMDRSAPKLEEVRLDLIPSPSRRPPKDLLEASAKLPPRGNRKSGQNLFRSTPLRVPCRGGVLAPEGVAMGSLHVKW